MKKKSYKTPKMTMRIMEPQQMLADSSDPTADASVKTSDGQNANSSSEFPSDGDGYGDTSDSKHGSYNPWTEWDDMPTWK